MASNLIFLRINWPQCVKSTAKFGGLVATWTGPWPSVEPSLLWCSLLCVNGSTLSRRVVAWQLACVSNDVTRVARVTSSQRSPMPNSHRSTRSDDSFSSRPVVQCDLCMTARQSLVCNRRQSGGSSSSVSWRRARTSQNILSNDAATAAAWNYNLRNTRDNRRLSDCISHLTGCNSVVRMLRLYIYYYAILQRIQSHRLQI